MRKTTCLKRLRLAVNPSSRGRDHLSFFAPNPTPLLWFRQQQNLLSLGQNNRQVSVAPTTVVVRYSNHGCSPSNGDRCCWILTEPNRPPLFPKQLFEPARPVVPSSKTIDRTIGAQSRLLCVRKCQHCVGRVLFWPTPLAPPILWQWPCEPQNGPVLHSANRDDSKWHRHWKYRWLLAGAFPLKFYRWCHALVSLSNNPYQIHDRHTRLQWWEYFCSL